MAKTDEQWEIESDADAVIRAAMVKANKKRWPKVKAELLKRQAALKTAIKK